jgi:predicted cupin superfamily sugar epimerase
MHPRAAELIRALDLVPHPEGGFFREAFRSRSRVRPADGRGDRAALTTIFFLLPEGHVSRWHAVSSDEVWHLYEGGPLELILAPPDLARLEHTRLASVGAEERPARTVPAGWWQAALSIGEYSLAGCTVAPGFEYVDFRLLADDRYALAKINALAPELARFV